MAKYKVDDILLMGDYTAEYFQVVSVNPVQYVLQAYYVSGEPNGAPFVLQIEFVDAGTWHKKAGISPYVWYGLGALAVVGLIVLAGRNK